MSTPQHERGAAPARTAPTRTDAAAKQYVTSKRMPVVGQPVAEELLRRRLAAERSAPLPCRCRDPWTCRHAGGEPCDDATLDRWLAAAALLTRLGFPPLIPRPVLAALSRRGRT